MGGHAIFNWLPKGLMCTLTLPCAEGRNLARAALRQVSSGPPRTDGAGKTRVLLVEDEALVAMMMSGFLEQLDCTVIGPCATCFEALSLLKENEIDVAILDVNLGGETVYPVADALARQGVPFAFATGYGRETIESRFAHMTTLEKPVGFDDLRNTMRELCGAAAERADLVNLRA